MLVNALRTPEGRSGYVGWFADATEAEAYQRSQFAGSLGPARALSKLIPWPAEPQWYADIRTEYTRAFVASG